MQFEAAGMTQTLWITQLAKSADFTQNRFPADKK